MAASRLPAEERPAAPVTATPAATAAEEPPPVIGGRSVVLRPGSDGHFSARVYVNDHPIDMLVDTGATLIILTPADARRAGIDPSAPAETVMVSTAAGRVPAKRALLHSVRIDRVGVDTIDALIMPHGLETSLLGMNFLSRLKRFEVSQRGLVLVQ